MQRILLHVCCAPCATWPVERLQAEFALTLFFANSNIAPAAEYARRRDEVQRLGALLQLPVVEDSYAHACWRDQVRGLEDEPEKGQRCSACFRFSLGRAASYASANGFAGFTTSLTVSPHKPTRTIVAIGREFDGFRAYDFKKQNGFQRSLELSRIHNLYRQNYCGCEFSIRLP